MEKFIFCAYFNHYSKNFLFHACLDFLKHLVMKILLRVTIVNTCWVFNYHADLDIY